MGSFNTTCMLTRKIIDTDTEVVMLMLTRKRAFREMPVYTWDLYAPVPILFEGSYNGRGTVSGARLYQSLPVLAADDLVRVEDALLSSMRDKMAGTNKARLGKKVTSFDTLLTETDLGFIKEEPRLVMVNTVLTLQSELRDDAEKLKLWTEHVLGLLGMKDIEEAKQYAKDHKNEKLVVPVGFMLCRKDAFEALLATYGVGDTNADHYAPKAQALRQATIHGAKDSNIEEMMHFLNGAGDYAGANSPAFTFSSAVEKFKSTDSSLASNMATLSHLQGADITVLNDYFNALGVTYQPTMAVNEDLQHYGHTEAHALQQALLAPTGTPSPKPTSQG